MDKAQEVKKILARYNHFRGADAIALEIVKLFTPPTDEGLRESLAEAEHDQWMRWAKSLEIELIQLTATHIECFCHTCQRLRRWQKLFIPYERLTEEQKDQDRKEADIVLAILADSKQGR